MPGLSADAHTPRDVPPVYVAATAPKMQALAGEISDGCLTPSITTPAFVRYTRENVAADIDIGCTVVASIHESDRDAGRDGAREIAGMYLANKFQNIRGSADTLLELAGHRAGRDRARRRGDGAGRRLAAKAKVTDALLDRCKPIAGTPDDCIAAIEEYREAGCTHVMLELWGDRRHDQIRLFGEKVLPHFGRERLRRSRVRRLRGGRLGSRSRDGSPSCWSPITSLAVDATARRGACRAGLARPRRGHRRRRRSGEMPSGAARRRPASMSLPRWWRSRRGGTPRRPSSRRAATELPFADGSFDAVVGNNVIQHIGEPERGGPRAPTGPGSRRSHRVDELGRAGALALLRSRTGSRRGRRGAVADRGARRSLVLPVHGRRGVPRAAGGRRLRGGRRRAPSRVEIPVASARRADHGVGRGNRSRRSGASCRRRRAARPDAAVAARSGWRSGAAVHGFDVPAPMKLASGAKRA